MGLNHKFKNARDTNTWSYVELFGVTMWPRYKLEPHTQTLCIGHMEYNIRPRYI